MLTPKFLAQGFPWVMVSFKKVEKPVEGTCFALVFYLMRACGVKDIDRLYLQCYTSKRR